MNNEDVKVVPGSGKCVSDFSYLCEGDVDPSLNKKIYTLVEADKNYIVYLDDDLSPEWSLTDDYDLTGMEYFGYAASRIGVLEGYAKAMLRKKQLAPLNRLLAEAMARVLGQKDDTRAKDTLNMADKYLQARGQENARTWYIYGAGSITLFSMIALIWSWLARFEIRELLGVTTHEVIMAACLGSIGAFASILLRSKTITIDAAAGSYIHYIESAARVIIGAIGGSLMALAIKANIILGTVQAYGPAGVCFFCMAAGASERILPGLIRVAERELDKESQEGVS